MLVKRILPVLVLLIVVLGGLQAYRYLQRPSADQARAALGAQSIEPTPETFVAEIRAGHASNVPYFLLLGATPATQVKDGTSALLAAAEIGNAEALAPLLNALPADVAAAINLPDSAGKTPLLAAVERGDTALATALLGHGADVTMADNTGQTPVLLAAKHGFTPLASLLLDADQQQHQSTLTANSQDKSGNTPLNYAINAQNVALVKRLIQAKVDSVSPDLSGITPLMIASSIGNTEVSGLLLDEGAKINVADRHGNTPLTNAIRHSRPAMVQFLVSKGADVDFHTNGVPALQAAVESQPFSLPLFQYLLTHSKQSAAVAGPLLLDAVDSRNEVLVKTLLDRNLNAKATDARGATLLYHAIASGNEANALALIAHGADVRQTGVVGITPLEAAARMNEPLVVRAILAQNVAPDQKTSEGYTVAEVAVYRGYPGVLQALLEKNARIQKDFGILWSIRDGHGLAVPVLLNFGANPNVMSENGDPALWMAASYGEDDAVKALIAHHAALDQPNRALGMTPLTIAAHAGKLPVVAELIGAGAKTEAQDMYGMTPLAHAAFMTHPEVVRFLLQHGANPKATDKQGRSISDIAGLATASSARDAVLALLQ